MFYGHKLEKSSVRYGHKVDNNHSKYGHKLNINKHNRQNEEEKKKDPNHSYLEKYNH